jgi:hypothetical protein
VFNQALRRPLVTSGAALAVTAATAAGYASAAEPQTSRTSFTVSAEAVAQATEASDAQIDTNTYLASAKNAVNTSRSAVTAQAAATARAEAAAQARRDAEARAARAKQRQALASQAQSDPKALARLLLDGYGWGSQFSCLDSLWTKESNWNYQATNGSSGAYGIPQALPGSKMGSVAPDWQTNPATQIKWGLQYIKATYGSPCAAWGHSQANGWY